MCFVFFLGVAITGWLLYIMNASTKEDSFTYVRSIACFCFVFLHRCQKLV